MNDPAPPRRRIRTLSEARDLVSAWKASGQNKEAWCRSQGILRSTLQSCMIRIEERGSVPAGFIEVKPAQPNPVATSAPVDSTNSCRVNSRNSCRVLLPAA